MSVTLHRIAPAFLALLSACLALPIRAGDTDGKKYTYTNLGVADGSCGIFAVGTQSQFPAAIKVVIDTSPGKGGRAPRGKFFGCHTGQGLLSCEGTLYHCFRTAALHFSVPKARGLHVGQRWTTMDTTFDVIRTEGIGYLGTHHETFVIATPNKQNGTNYFYWSEDAGLLAMRWVMEFDKSTSVDAFVAEGARGFPF
jgi:hypothetical protein